MRTRNLTKLAIAAAVTIAGAARAQSVRLAVGAESKIWIEGGSNLHDWSCKATSFVATIDVDSGFLKGATITSSSLKTVLVTVPVRNLKCGHGGMDNNLYKALKADDTPDVNYLLKTLDVVPAAANDSFTVKAVGALKIAGTEKEVTMDVAVTRGSDGTVRVNGALPLLMTDFGVKPPTAMFGTLRTDNKVTVKFALVVGPQPLTAAVAGDPR